MFEPHKVAYRHPKYKTAYRVKNWPEYEKSLRNRGDITVWFSQDAIKTWTPRKNGKWGGQPVYSDIAIETGLSLRLIFQLPLRQTEGHEQDPSQVPDLLDQVDREIDCFVGDGIYDREPVYRAVQQHSSEASMIVPPRKDAVLSNSSIGVLSQRNQHISKIEKMGRSDWCRQSGYYLQSHVENTFYRFKRIIGGRLRSKHGEAQEHEALLGCAILNKMLEIGRPVSYPVC